MGPSQRFILVLSLAILVAAAPTAVLGQAESWPIKQFEVINVAPLEFEDLPQSPYPDVLSRDQVERLLIRASRLLPEDIEAAGLRTVIASDSLADAMRDMEIMLERSATQFEAWRFPPPLLEPVVTRNGAQVIRTYLLAAIFTASGQQASGEYHNPTCVPPPSRETILTLSADQLLRAIERQNADGTTSAGMTLTKWGLQTLAHELFHSVQFAMPFYENAFCGNSVGAWITEGMARAVGVDMFRSLGTGFQSVSAQRIWGRRNYSERLAIPFIAAIGNSPPAYNTASFWRYLAELNSAGVPGPAPGPVDYSYLADFLNTQPSGRDCVLTGDPCDTEIARLDGWLKSNFGGKGLREHLPKFLAAYVHYGEARGTGGTPASRNKAWRDASFEDGCMAVELSPEPMEMDGIKFGGPVHEDPAVSVKETAARCWSLGPVDFEGDMIGVEIEVRSPSESVLSQLVAVRASRQTGEVSIQEAIVEVNQITGEPRARFMFPFKNGEATPFLLVNVAGDAQTTTDIEDMPIRFTAINHYVVMEIQGDSETPQAGSSIDYEIGPAIVSDLSGVNFGLFFDPPAARGTCLVMVNLSSDQKDELYIGGTITPPLRPGSYVFRRDGGKTQVPDVLGATLWLNSKSVGSGNHNQFSGRSGTLDITSVSPFAIVGDFSVLMTLGLGGEHVEALGKFSLPPGLPGVGNFFGRFDADHPCLAVADSGSSGSGNGSSPGGPGPEDPSFTDDAGDSPADNPDDLLPPDAHPDTVPHTPSSDAQPSARAGAETEEHSKQNSVMLDFLEIDGREIGSAAQIVQGSIAIGVALSSSTFNLTLTIPQRELTECALGLRDPMGYLAYLSMATSTQGGRVSETVGSSLSLIASGGEITLTVGVEGGTIVLRGVAAEGASHTSTSTETVRVEVTGASLEFSMDGQGFACDNLVDFAFEASTLQ